MDTFIANRTSALEPLEAEVLGDGSDRMTDVEMRLRKAYPTARAIAWEGDAATFQFTYVSKAAEQLLGYPIERWTREPTFWAEEVVLEQDRREAVAYCALATASKRDHVFEYRAQTADGRIVIIRDVVRVIVSPRGIPERLRGLMFDVSNLRAVAVTSEQLSARQQPSRSELEALAPA